MSTCHRVLLAVAFPARPEPLVAAMRSTPLINGEIRVVYVEDRNLLRLAELDCAREIGGTSALPATTRLSDLTRALRRHAEQLESGISEAFAGSATRLHFEIVVGTVATVALERAPDADITLLAQAAPFSIDYGGSLGRSQLQEAPLLVLTSSGTAADLRALAFGEHLGRASGHPLRSMRLKSDSDRGGVETDACLASAEGSLAVAVRRIRPWAVIVSASAGPDPVRTLSRLSDAYEVGVFLVR